MASALTPKQEKFAQNIVKGMSQADAYRNSFNVKPNTKDETCQNNGYKVMQIGEVRARIDELRAPVIKKIQLSREWVLEQLIEVVEMAKALDPVVSKDGQTSGEIKQNLAAANKALELLGKEQGMFVDRSKVDVNSNVTVTMSEADAEL